MTHVFSDSYRIFMSRKESLQLFLKEAWELITNKHANPASTAEKLCDLLLWPLRELRGQSPFVLLKSEIPPNHPYADRYITRTTRVCTSVRRNIISQLFLKAVALVLFPISLLGIIPKGILGLIGQLGEGYEGFLFSPPFPNRIKFLEDPISYLISERDSFYGAQTVLPGGFKECACVKSHNFGRLETKRRQKIEQKIIEHIKENYSTDQEIKYFSLGSGKLLQDYIIICKLIDLGYKNINITLVDTDYGERFFVLDANYSSELAKSVLDGKVDDTHHVREKIRVSENETTTIFKSLMLYYSEHDGCKISVNTYRHMEEAKKEGKMADILLAIDLNCGLEESALDLQRAHQCLNEKGRFFLSDDVNDYVFNQTGLLTFETQEATINMDEAQKFFFPIEAQADLAAFIGSEEKLNLYALSGFNGNVTAYLKTVLPTIIPKDCTLVNLNMVYKPTICYDGYQSDYNEASVTWYLEMLYPEIQFEVHFDESIESAFSRIESEKKCVAYSSAYVGSDNCFVLGSTALYKQGEKTLGLMWSYDSPQNPQPKIMRQEGPLSVLNEPNVTSKEGASCVI